LIEVERVDFVSIPTQDIERAKEFYGVTLGLAENGPGEFDGGNVTLGLWQPEADGETFAPNPAGIALRVPDVAEARRELEGAGVEFKGETYDSGVCHMAFFIDPDGNWLILHRRYAE
jgi:catechol 2,3-dioxygenase-like lactoylglutathione lyase family enzyme